MEVKKVSGARKGSIYFTCSADAGFFYRNKSVKDTTRYLVCVNRNCSARATCDAGDHNFLKLGDQHNQIADPAMEEALRLKEVLWQTAETSSQDIKTTYVQKSSSVSVEAAAKLGFPAVSKSLRRARQKNQSALPNSLREFGDICQNNNRFGVVDEKPFCRGSVGEEGYVSVIFLSEDLIHLLAEAKE